MNIITRETLLPKELEFKNLLTDFIQDSYNRSYHGSTFLRKSITEINEEYFPELDRSFDGFWETNEYLIDSEKGLETDKITSLTRVKEVVKTVVSRSWVPVTE